MAEKDKKKDTYYILRCRIQKAFTRTLGKAVSSEECHTMVSAKKGREASKKILKT